jgi:hypothetical protein
MLPTCPRCQSARIVEGRNFNWIAGGTFQYFQPKELRLLGRSSHIRIKKSDFFACTGCGLLWSEVDSKKLQALVVENGNKAVKARLGI